MYMYIESCYTVFSFINFYYKLEFEGSFEDSKFKVSTSEDSVSESVLSMLENSSRAFCFLLTSRYILGCIGNIPAYSQSMTS